MEKEFLPPERIGFVGLGNMGAPMARHIAAAGYQLVVADASPTALEKFRGAVRCETRSSLTELGRACRLVITMLPDGAAVRQVVSGPEGLAAGLTRGSVVLDMTSAEPVGTRSLGLKLAESGIALVDAPVSGGVKRAVEGTLAIMVGGDPQIVAKCAPLLERMGKLFQVGASGAGHAAKALNNYLSAIALAATGEAMLAAQNFGIEPRVMLDILNHSTGRNTATDQKYPAFVLPRTFNSGFALGLMAKDLRIARGLAQAVGVEAALLTECSEIYDRAERELGFGADNTEIVKYLETRMGSGTDD